MTMLDMTLYWYPGTCARVPFVALEEIGVPFEVHVLDRDAGEDHSPQYRALNPKGKVPTLVVDGHAITENPAIQMFLGQSFPEARLLPSGDPWITLDALSTMVWFAAAVHPLVRRLRFPASVSAEPVASESVRTIARAQLEEAFAILEARLGDREWLYREWSIVDAYMLWLWFRATGSGMDGSAFPRCAAHARRVEERPSVARVLDREEREMERIVSVYGRPEGMPPHRVGRAPLVAATA
jgi:glutathione S-transferase